MNDFVKKNSYTTAESYMMPAMILLFGNSTTRIWTRRSNKKKLSVRYALLVSLVKSL